MYQLKQSPVVAAIGLLFALIAILGMEFLEWEWGGVQPVPTLIGVVAAGIAVFLGAKGIRQ